MLYCGFGGGLSPRAKALILELSLLAICALGQVEARAGCVHTRGTVVYLSPALLHSEGIFKGFMQKKNQSMTSLFSNLLVEPP